MIKFNIFGVPVVILPWHWLGMAMIGGVFGAKSYDSLLLVVLFMVAGSFSLLAHELGHALSGRRMGGGYPHIVMEMFGGYCSNETARYRTRTDFAKMVFAGPGVNIVLLVISLLLMAVFGGLSYCVLALVSPYASYAQAVSEVRMDLMTLQYAKMLFLLSCFVWVNFWWTLFNLLPIYPLDGGQILGAFMSKPGNTHRISIATIVVVAILGIYFGFGGILLWVFLGNFLFLNWQYLKQLR